MLLSKSCPGPKGPTGEIFPIGHQSFHSKTLLPQIETDYNNSIVYADFAGLWDTRRAELNIANAVTIKKIIKSFNTVRFVILINYHSLKSDRGNGMKNIIKASQILFSSESSLLKHKKSVYFGITASPPDFYLGEFKETIREEEPKLEAFADRFFSYDPLDQYGEGFWKRKEFIENLKKMDLINKKDYGDLFKTVLKPEDKGALKEIFEGINENIISHIKNMDIEKSIQQLKLLSDLKEIDNPFVDQLIERSNVNLKKEVQSLIKNFEIHCAKQEFHAAQKLLDFFTESEKFMTDRMKMVVSIKRLTEIINKSKEDKKKHDKEIEDKNKEIKELKNRPPQVVHHHHYEDDDGICLIM